MIRAVAIGAVAAALLAPATASAFGPKTASAAPASTQAGANSDFTVHFDVDESARVVVEEHLDLDGGVAARVEDLAGSDGFDRCHVLLLSSAEWIGPYVD